MKKSFNLCNIEEAIFQIVGQQIAMKEEQNMMLARVLNALLSI